MTSSLWRRSRRALSLAGLGFPLGAALAAQGTRDVRGSVTDRVSGAPLGGAVIAVLDRARPASPACVTSSPAGAFTVRLTGDSIRLVAAFIGYAPETLTVVP